MLQGPVPRGRFTDLLELTLNSPVLARPTSTMLMLLAATRLLHYRLHLLLLVKYRRVTIQSKDAVLPCYRLPGAKLDGRCGRG